ncbi:MAG: aldo/keto reductase [Candidatus Latescibacteria bacterium]|nr:aldo/keto reductase [Candidatus Latescibacterota bacterium]
MLEKQSRSGSSGGPGAARIPVKSGSAIDPFAKRLLGKSALSVPQLGFGGGTLGDPNEIISDEKAQETLATAYAGGIRYFDTAPWYGVTKSEHRLGQFLRRQPRDSFAINTKVGRVFYRPDNPATFSQDRWKGGLPFQLRFDYTRDGLRRSYEDSLQRLGMNQVDALAVHDLDYKFHLTDQGVDGHFSELDQGGGFEWLLELKARGEIKAIGAGVNQAQMIPEFVDRFKGWDYFLVAMPYTLLDQPALDEAFDLCRHHDISVIVGAVYASGILATGAKEDPLYAYKPAERKIVEKVRRIEAICARYDFPIGAAALQFPLGHPVVAAVIPGSNSPEIVKANLEWIQIEIPQDFWNELKNEGLLRKGAPTP